MLKVTWIWHLKMLRSLSHFMLFSSVSPFIVFGFLLLRRQSSESWAAMEMLYSQWDLTWARCSATKNHSKAIYEWVSRFFQFKEKLFGLLLAVALARDTFWNVSRARLEDFIIKHLRDWIVCTCLSKRMSVNVSIKFSIFPSSARFKLTECDDDVDEDEQQ